MPEGWIKLHRKIVDSMVFAKPEILKLWILCLALANHEEGWVDVDGQVDPVKVERGEFVTGRYSLHNHYYQFRKRKSNKSPITIWRWLEKLEKAEKLNIKSNNKYSLIQIPNYDYYQSRETDEHQSEHQMNIRRTSDEHQMNTNKNEKNEKNEKKYIPTLDEVKKYFRENGYDTDVAEKAFNIYNASLEDHPRRKYWRDSRDNKIKNWKLKMQSVWFTEENRKKAQTDGYDIYRTNSN